MKLNKKWAIAILIPLEEFEFNVAAIKAVIVVPILAPSIKGAASFKVAIFFATIGTTTDVVMVLERIAAVVTSTHPNDLSWFLKKNRLNNSGDFAASRLEINLLKISIEPNSNARAIIANKNGLLMFANKKSIIGAKPNQKWETVFCTGLLCVLKNRSAIQMDIEERKP